MIEPVLQRPPRTPLVPPGGADLHERDMTATFSCDLSLRQVQEQLANVDQWLPIDGDADLTLGQLIDANSTGPLRLGYGAWRDLLLGAQFLNGRSELVSAGGRTVKNVAGYDLTKFMVGQHGVFGRLVAVTLRTYRRPAGAVLATFASSATRLGEMLVTPLRPQWAMLTSDALLLGYLGDARTVDFYAAKLPESGASSVVRRSVADDSADRQAHWATSSPRSFRASVPPARLLDFVREAKLSRFAADAAFGIVVGATPDSGNDLLTAAAKSFDGSVTFFDRSVDPPRVHFSRMSKAETAVLHRLKAAFDPDGALNPLPWEAA